MLRLTITVLLTALTAVSVAAQKQPKSWSEWSKKDAEKMLNDSPWGQTQTETDTSEMFFKPTSNTSVGTGSNSTSRGSQGATNTEVNLNYRIRFFSAKPIRQAFARQIEINQPSMPKATMDQLGAWSNVHTDDWIIVAVTVDSTDQRYTNPANQAFGSATTDLVKNNAYLERKDGKKIFLNEYDAPGKDGSGAKFVFPRVLDGKPFLTADGGEVRFHAEFVTGSTSIQLDRRFKLADMMYDGQLEY
jgi:hypothetical protein